MPNEELSFEDWAQVRAYVTVCGQLGISRDDLARMAELDRLRFDKILSGEEPSDAATTDVIRALIEVQDAARAAAPARRRLEQMIARHGSA